MTQSSPPVAVHTSRRAVAPSTTSRRAAVALPVQAGQRMASFAEVLVKVLGPAVNPPPSLASSRTAGVHARTAAVSAGHAPTAATGIGATGSARIGNGPMALGDFPRPAGDNGRGIHWIPTGTQSPEVVDRFVAEAKAMKITWVTLLNDNATIGKRKVSFDGTKLVVDTAVKN